MEARRKAALREQQEKLIKQENINQLKNDWERYTDNKILQNKVKRRVHDQLKTHSFDLEDRRERCGSTYRKSLITFVAKKLLAAGIHYLLSLRELF